MRRPLLLLASIALAVLLGCGAFMVEAVRPAQAAFPGKNGKIVLVQGGGDTSGMKLLNPNDSGLTSLTRSASGSDPAMSPNGTRVAYARARLQNSEIIKINVNNRKRTQITDNEVFDGDPTWSPDGTRIAFVSGEVVRDPVFGTYIGHTDIFVRRADGTGETVNLTNTPNEDEWAPAWSPNGEEIAFHIRDYPLDVDIVVQNLDTGQRRNLTNDGTANYDYSPSWSPYGARIVFQSSRNLPDGCYQLRSISTINASDGSDKRLLAQARLDTCFVDGSWFVGTTYSPNGRKIAYVQTNIDGQDEPKNSIVYTINDSEDSNKQRIYATDKEKDRTLSSPDWGVKVRR